MSNEIIANEKNQVVSHRWSVALIVLFFAFSTAAALNFLRVSGGFLTNYCADITGPAYLYIIYRELYQLKRSNNSITRFIGSTPETCALVMFTGSTFTEISQYYWPHGIFNGYFDPLDILAFAVGVGACYAFDKLSCRR